MNRIIRLTHYLINIQEDFMKKIVAIILSSALLACTSTATIRSTNGSSLLKVNNKTPINIGQKTKQTYPVTSFGKYKFKLTKKGRKPMYGIIPLKFNGGYLALDILFFTPAMLFNLREAYPYYEFDIGKKVVKYKKRASDEWSSYKPTEPDIEQAKSYFGE